MGLDYNGDYDCLTDKDILIIETSDNADRKWRGAKHYRGRDKKFYNNDTSQQPSVSVAAPAAPADSATTIICHQAGHS